MLAFGRGDNAVFLPVFKQHGKQAVKKSVGKTFCIVGEVRGYQSLIAFGKAVEKSVVFRHKGLKIFVRCCVKHCFLLFGEGRGVDVQFPVFKPFYQQSFLYSFGGVVFVVCGAVSNTLTTIIW